MPDNKEETQELPIPDRSSDLTTRPVHNTEYNEDIVSAEILTILARLIMGVEKQAECSRLPDRLLLIVDEQSLQCDIVNNRMYVLRNMLRNLVLSVWPDEPELSEEDFQSVKEIKSEEDLQSINDLFYTMLPGVLNGNLLYEITALRSYREDIKSYDPPQIGMQIIQNFCQSLAEDYYEFTEKRSVNAAVVIEWVESVAAKIKDLTLRAPAFIQKKPKPFIDGLLLYLTDLIIIKDLISVDAKNKGQLSEVLKEMNAIELVDAEVWKEMKAIKLVDAKDNSESSEDNSCWTGLRAFCLCFFRYCQSDEQNEHLVANTEEEPDVEVVQCQP